MNIKLSTVITILAVATSPLFAEDAATSANENEARSYVGVKGGLMSIGSGISWNDDGVLLGILYGHEFEGSNWAIEGEFNTTVSKATSDIEGYGDLGLTTLGVYGVYKTPGRFYLKAKMGLLYEYYTSSVSGIGITIDVDGPGMAISLGLGGGVQITDRLIGEIEYTMLDADVSYASLGLNWML